jgi:hypothetical protein
MTNKIKIEQVFRASYQLEASEIARIAAEGVHLREVGEEIAEDGHDSCEKTDRHDEVECSLKFENKDMNVGYSCERDLNQQSPCADKRMPTVCTQRLLAALCPLVSIDDVPAELV